MKKQKVVEAPQKQMDIILAGRIRLMERLIGCD